MEKIEFQINRQKLDTTLNIVVSLNGVTVNGVKGRFELFQQAIVFDTPISIKGERYLALTLQEEESQKILDAANELRRRENEYLIQMKKKLRIVPSVPGMVPY